MLKMFRLGGTDFTLNWIPFGAFVLPKGENDPTVPGGMASAAPVKRLLVLLGGPLMNILTAVLLFAVIYARVGVPDLGKVLVASISTDTPAQTAGMQAGDIFISADGQPIANAADLQAIVQTKLDQEMTFVLQRGGQPITVIAVPRKDHPTDQGPLGVTLDVPYKSGTTGETAYTGIKYGRLSSQGTGNLTSAIAQRDGLCESSPLCRSGGHVQHLFASTSDRSGKYRFYHACGHGKYPLVVGEYLDSPGHHESITPASA